MSAPRLKVECAWCPGFKPPGAKATLTSHGICPQCFARLMDAEPPPDEPDAEPEADDGDEDLDDDDPNDCAECGRSHGPHYRGPCEHSGPTVDFHD